MFSKVLKIIVCYSLLFAFAFPLWGISDTKIAQCEKPIVRIGILAYRPKEVSMPQWRALEQILNEKLPQCKFHVELFDYESLNQAVRNQAVEFVLTNASHYIFLQRTYALSAPLVTLANFESGEKLTQFGGVIFTEKESPIQKIKEIKNQTIAITDTNSLGGYRVQAYELLKNGINVDKDNTMLVVGIPHDNVVEAVLNHKATVGFVRTGVLETMAKEGLVDMSRLKILDEYSQRSFPLHISTKLYPEWPLASMNHISDALARDVMAVLLKIPHDGTLAQAMHIHGFHTPQDYAVIEDLLRTLRLPPYDTLPNFTLHDIGAKYYHAIVVGMIVLVSIVLCVMIILVFNYRRLQKSYMKERELGRDLEQFLQIIEQAPISIVVTDLEGNIVYVNSTFTTITGYTKEESLHHNPRMLKSQKTPQKTYDELWEHLLRGEVWEGELINFTKDHREYTELATIAPIRDENGKITHYVGMKEDITERKKNELIIHQLAYYDQLTTLANRQKLEADLDEKQPSACLIFNIDAFKEINDLFGFYVGDSILKQVGLWLNYLYDHTYRTGGDEFTVLLYEPLNAKELEHRIGLFQNDLAEKVFYVDEESINLQMTIGAALGEKNILTHADIALHFAKEKKVDFYLYEPAVHIEKNYRHNLDIATQIRKAILEGRIICHYQPIVNANNPHIVKYETLVRMIDEYGAIISPADFLPIAKKMKIYSRITQEVVYQACTLFEGSDIEFSINISMLDIEDSKSMSVVLETIERTKTAHQIVFEILESEGIENYGNVQKFIEKVKALGARIAIDDFGTGYSNYVHILKMNIDYIKIDGSLIQGMLENEKNLILVESMIQFAKSIGIKTVAEFVSNEALYEKVKSIGIDYVQGFYIGRPTALVFLDNVE